MILDKGNTTEVMFGNGKGMIQLFVNIKKMFIQYVHCDVKTAILGDISKERTVRLCFRSEKDIDQLIDYLKELRLKKREYIELG